MRYDYQTYVYFKAYNTYETLQNEMYVGYKFKVVTCLVGVSSE